MNCMSGAIPGGLFHAAQMSLSFAPGWTQHRQDADPVLVA